MTEPITARPSLLVEVSNLAAALLTTYPDWRPGQAAFNAFHRIDPAGADKIRSTAFDPFHVDDRLPDFWQWLAGYSTTTGDKSKEGTQ